MSKMLKPLFFATRPQTYPLAIASILYAQGLAYQQLGVFSAKNWLIAILTLLTAVILQIISNLANDYGDGIKGTDHYRDKNSPQRALASGMISASVLKTAIKICTFFSIVAGLLLLTIALDDMVDFVVFVGLGLLSVLGAFAYTMGKYPYGYWALGEFFVLIFFGYVGVFGAYYLQVSSFDNQTFALFLLASGAGLLCACVLYINNMRDVVADAKAHKTTLATLFGQQYMVYGYGVLFVLALMCLSAYGWYFKRSALWFLLGLPWYIYHLFAVYRWRHFPQKIGQLLKPLVLTIFFISILINFL